MLDVFDFKPVAGDVHELKRAQSVIISRSTAEQLGVGVGDMLWCNIDQPSAENAREVVAIFEDFPQNSLMGRCHMAMDLGDKSLDDPSEWSYNYYVRLQPGADPGAIADGWEKFFIEMNPSAANEDGHLDTAPRSSVVHPRPLLRARQPRAVRAGVARDDLHAAGYRPCWSLRWPSSTSSTSSWRWCPSASVRSTPSRSSAPRTPRCASASSSRPWGWSSSPCCWPWYLSFAIQGTELASYISAPLDLAQNLPVIGILLVVALVMALVASLYPAWYITSFPPAMVVKGAFSGTAGGRRLRTLLLGFQFTISMGLIIATGFILRQHNFMLQQDMGFDRRNLMAAQLSGKAAQSYDALRSRLLADPRVVDVTAAEGQLVNVSRMGWGRRYKDEAIALQAYIVRWNFLKMMGIPIVDGRDFLESDEHKETGMLICNETAPRRIQTRAERRNRRIPGYGPARGCLRRLQLPADAVQHHPLRLLCRSR